MYQCCALAPLLLQVLNNRRNWIRLLHGAGTVNQELRRKSRSQILIKQRAHSGGKLQAGEEVLINPATTNDEKRLYTQLHPPHREQSEHRAVRQFLLLQERSFGN